MDIEIKDDNKDVDKELSKKISGLSFYSEYTQIQQQRKFIITKLINKNLFSKSQIVHFINL